MKNVIKHLLRKSGYEISKYTSNEEYQNLIKLIESLHIDTIFDVGANVGQYATRMRTLGFPGVIHSFEPLPDAFAQIKSVSSLDVKWIVHNYALGDESGSAVMHRSENSYSSSILEMEDRHLEVAPQSRVVEKIDIEIRTLDEILPSLNKIGDRRFLKLDTQGFEKAVIEGASRSLKDISAIQMEMSLVPLYENESLFPELLQFMTDLGFELYQLIPGLVDNRDGRLLQVDGVFVKK